MRQQPIAVWSVLAFNLFSRNKCNSVRTCERNSPRCTAAHIASASPCRLRSSTDIAWSLDEVPSVIVRVLPPYERAITCRLITKSYASPCQCRGSGTSPTATQTCRIRLNHTT
jgi:hypothetical protein